MPRKISSVVCVLLTAFLVQAASPQETAPPAQQTAVSQKPAADAVDENVPYGSANGTPLLLDVYKPSGHGSLHPAVVMIHAGGWSDLDKSTMRNMGRYLARSGYVAVSVHYRLVKGNQNQWPAQPPEARRQLATESVAFFDRYLEPQ